MEENETKEMEETQEMEEKPRWIDLFERQSHRRHQTEYMRDKEYEEIITTLRRGFSEEADDSTSAPPYHIPVPAETYFLTPDPTLHDFSLPTGKHSGSSRTFSSSQSESSFGGSTVTTSAPASSRKCLQLPPEVVEEKRKYRRRRTAAYICLGVLSLALVALAVGVILHFLLETERSDRSYGCLSYERQGIALSLSACQSKPAHPTSACNPLTKTSLDETKN